MMTEDETRKRSTSLDDLLKMSKALGMRVREYHAEDAIRCRHLRTLLDQSALMVKHAKTLQRKELLVWDREGR
jgi:hypothetical protein